MGYSLLLFLHICGAGIGLLSGTAALIFRKGFRLHRAAGNVFFVSMLIMSASGAGIAAFIKPNMGNVFGGVVTFYLVATGWLTVLRKEGETGLVEFGLLLVALAAGGGGLLYGWDAAHSATGLKEGYPPAPYLVFGSLLELVGSRAGRVDAGSQGGFWGVTYQAPSLADVRGVSDCRLLLFSGQAAAFPRGDTREPDP